MGEFSSLGSWTNWADNKFILVRASLVMCVYKVNPCPGNADSARVSVIVLYNRAYFDGRRVADLGGGLNVADLQWQT